MGETFKYVAPVAGAMGYSAEDVALAVGLMANSGIKASRAGTSLKAALVNMVKPTDDMRGRHGAAWHIDPKCRWKYKAVW